MDSCPECGVPLECDEARFCSQCGREVRPAGAVPPESRPAELENCGADDPLDCPRTLPHDDAAAEDEWKRSVQDKIADGAIDAADRADLERQRVELHLSEDEASRYEAEATEDMISAGPQEPTSPTGAPEPVAVEINPNHFYMAGYGCALHLRLRNRTGRALRALRLRVRGKLLGEMEEPDLELAPGECREVRLQIVPDVAGVHVLDVGVRGPKGGWTAQMLLQILERPTTATQIVFDQRISAGEGAKIGFGFSYRGADQNLGDIKDALCFDVNNLMHVDLPPRWVPLTLRPIRQARDAGPCVILHDLADRAPIPGKAGLFWGEGPEVRRLLLLGGTKVTLGRGRVCDVVLRLHPRTPANDRVCLQIAGSRPHVVLSLRPEGVFLRDENSYNGTSVDGHRLLGEMALPLGRSSEIDLARALRLRVIPITDEADAVPPASRYARLGATDSTADLAASLGLAAVVIERLDNLPRTERYVIVYRWAPFRIGRAGELFLPCAPGSAPHVRLVRRAAGFWLEAIEPGALTAEGRRLAPGDAVPLAHGITLATGGETVTAGPWAQVGL